MTPRAVELTPRGTGAVAVILVSGPEAFEYVRALAPTARIEPRVPCVARLIARGRDLDEALVVALDPEHVEIHLHGSPVLVRWLLAEFETATEPLVEAGHAGAADRCFEDRARILLGGARTESGARILLDQVEGALRTELLRMSALDAQKRERSAALLLENSRIARAAIVPASVVLAGSTNAGKSTLFNVLVGEERSIVTSAPGTTRDVVSAPARFGAYPVLLHDTAGERLVAGFDAQAHIEAVGQARAREAGARADLVVWLQSCVDAPGDLRARAEPPAGSVVLETLADRAVSASAPPTNLKRISALAEPESARRAVEACFRSTFRLPIEPWTHSAPALVEAAAIEELTHWLRTPTTPRFAAFVRRCLDGGA